MRVNNNNGYSNRTAASGSGSAVTEDRTEEFLNRLQTYPNPSDGEIKLYLPSGDGTYTATLRDVQGKVVKRWTALTTRELSVTEMPAGTYILTVFNNTNVVLKERIIKK